jgi:glycosyltransferase involved in cell wall biosynthesis
MNILYLSPLLPAPSGSGGKRAVYNHILDLPRGPGGVCHLLCIDVDEEIGDGRLTFAQVDQTQVLPRAFPKFASGSRIANLVVALRQLCLDLRPRAVAAVSSDVARRWVRQQLASHAFDCVVLDHFSAAGLLPDRALPIPVLYIAHNFEAAIIRDRIDSDGAWIGRLLSKVEYFKTLRFERRLIDRSSAVVYIAAPDQKAMSSLLGNKPARVWPELSPLKRRRWSPPDRKALLFVGAARYFPNGDALGWLLRELMPRLLEIDPSIGLDIVGTARKDLHGIEAAPNVRFHGFVSDQSLEAAYLNASLFVSPIILGNGVKIKVLESVSYGLPVVATRQSMAGLEFLGDSLGELRRDNPAAAAAAIASLIAEPARLVAMSERMQRDYQAALLSRPPLRAVLDEVLAHSGGPAQAASRSL